jgi:hypothetical protein
METESSLPCLQEHRTVEKRKFSLSLQGKILRNIENGKAIPVTGREGP